MIHSSYDLLRSCLKGQQERVDQTLEQVLKVRRELRKRRDQLEHLLNLDRNSQNYLDHQLTAQPEDYLSLLQQMITREQDCVDHCSTTYDHLLKQLSVEKSSLRQMLSILGQGLDRKPVRQITLTEKSTPIAAEVKS